MIAYRIHFFQIFPVVCYVPAHYFRTLFSGNRICIMSALRALGTVGRTRMAVMNTSRRNMAGLPRDGMMYARVGMKLGESVWILRNYFRSHSRHMFSVAQCHISRSQCMYKCVWPPHPSWCAHNPHTLHAFTNVHSVTILLSICHVL